MLPCALQQEGPGKFCRQSPVIFFYFIRHKCQHQQGVALYLIEKSSPCQQGWVKDGSVLQFLSSNIVNCTLLSRLRKKSYIVIKSPVMMCKNPVGLRAKIKEEEEVYLFIKRVVES
jgi:hypothetical protein